MSCNQKLGQKVSSYDDLPYYENWTYYPFHINDFWNVQNQFAKHFEDHAAVIIIIIFVVADWQLFWEYQQVFVSMGHLWRDQPVRGESVSEGEEGLVRRGRKTQAAFGTDRISIVLLAPDGRMRG